MAGKYLMDTNAVIDYLSNKLPANASDLLDLGELEISVITRIELLAWRNADKQQLAVLEEFISNVTVWNLDEPIILKGIEVRKVNKLKLPDAIIAATALVHNLDLVTRNIDDFKNIDDIRLVNPWK
ncbi:MAG: type II toxin-antitoxin system VapC family toxin [Sediminibacterium magnilacihabitans]|jgi:tRNA(fMet)-specific endonuclease VapC|nr:type II toxin-antitoxin system VapC family toxin [Sediminibacterium magnilacihabitans]